MSMFGKVNLAHLAPVGPAAASGQDDLLRHHETEPTQG